MKSFFYFYRGFKIKGHYFYITEFMVYILSDLFFFLLQKVIFGNSVRLLIDHTLYATKINP